MTEPQRNDNPLFDESFQAMQKARAQKNGQPLSPLHLWAQDQLHDRLKDLKAPPAPACAWEEGKIDPNGCGVITSCLYLQTVNHLPAHLAAIHQNLKKGGLFLGAMLGGVTLYELRESLAYAENNLRGGLSPRMTPLLGMEEISRLLTCAGFHHPVVDHERVVITYPDLISLMKDLRAQSCTNSLAARSRQFAPRHLFSLAEKHYRQHHALPDGALPASFDVVFLHGWRE